MKMNESQQPPPANSSAQSTAPESALAESVGRHESDVALSGIAQYLSDNPGDYKTVASMLLKAREQERQRAKTAEDTARQAKEELESILQQFLGSHMSHTCGSTSTSSSTSTTAQPPM
jgi:hypothetical protein